MQTRDQPTVRTRFTQQRRSGSVATATQWQRGDDAAAARRRRSGCAAEELWKDCGKTVEEAVVESEGLVDTLTQTVIID